MFEFEEPRTENADRSAEYIDRINTAEVFADPASRREFLLGLDYPAFRDWLVRLNGLARGKSIAERGIDGEEVEVMTMMPPEPEDKEPLLNETLEAVKRVLNNPEDYDKGLETASLILSGAINFIHPFIDGNGRTSRVVGFLTRNGYDGSAIARQKLSRILGDEGNTAFYNNPGVLGGWLTYRVQKMHAPVDSGKWPLRINVSGAFGEDFQDSSVAQLSETSKKKINKVARDPAFGRVAVTKIMLERNLLPDGVVFGDKDFAVVAEDEYLRKFTDADIDAVVAESRAMRRDNLREFIKAMEDPDSFVIKLDEKSDSVEFQERTTTLRDYYNGIIENYSKIYGRENPAARRRRLAAGVALHNS